MLRRIAAHFFMPIISKPLLTNYAGYECMKTKRNNWRNFRKLNCSSKFLKMLAFLQNATRIFNNQCLFIFRHQLYRLIYCHFGVYWVNYTCCKYMCTARLIELTVAWRNSKAKACKMHAFLQNAISFAFLYSDFVWSNVQALNIQKLSRISFRC